MMLSEMLRNYSNDESVPTQLREVFADYAEHAEELEKAVTFWRNKSEVTDDREA